MKKQDRYFKIGITSNLASRLKCLQIGCPFKLSLLFWVRFTNKDGAENVEQLFHKKYKNKNIRGEWFCTKQLMIRNNTRNPLLRIKRFLASFPNAIEVSESLKNLTITKLTKTDIRYFIR